MSSNINPPEGFEFSGIPKFLHCDDRSLIVLHEIKRIEQPQDPHAELKAQYARDVETCRDIDGLEARELWQEKLKVNKNWTTLVKDAFTSHLSDYRRRPHADSILEYHRCSDEDKKRWQVKAYGEWVNDSNPSFMSSYEYRLPPKPFFIGKHEVPPPVTDPLKSCQAYWFFNLNGVFKAKWYGIDADAQRFSKRIIRLTEQDAKTCFEALQKTLKGE